MNHPNRGAKRHACPAPMEIGILRGLTGYTQHEAAQIVHVSDKAWAMWEQGMRPMPPGLWELYRLKTRHRMDEVAKEVRRELLLIVGPEPAYTTGGETIRANTWAALAAKVLESRRGEA